MVFIILFKHAQIFNDFSRRKVVKKIDSFSLRVSRVVKQVTENKQQ